jgi:PAS domain S-box-containing protein
MESLAPSSSCADDSLPTFCEEQLEKLLLSITDVICTIDLQGIFRYVSAASTRLWGYKPEEMIGVSYRNFIVPEDIEKTIQVVADREHDCYTTNFENRYFRKDGSIVPIIWSGRWDENDGLLYCVARDGSDKKDLEARLEKAQQMASVASLEYNFNKNAFTYLSDTFYSICGLELSNTTAISPAHFQSLIHPLDQDSITSLFTSPYCFQASKQEYRLQRPDGQLIYIFHQREIVFDAAHNPVKSFDTLQDITEHKTRELAIQQREERLEFLVQNGSDLIGIINPEGYYTYVADSVKNVLGFEKSDLIGKNVFEFIHPDDAANIAASLHNALLNRYLSVPPFRFKNSNNEWRWVETNAANFTDNPAINGIVTNSRDITERKHTEAELARSEQKFKSLVQNSSDIIVIIDEAGNFKDVSENVSSVLGFDPQFLLNKNAFDYIHPEDSGEVLSELTRVIQNSPEAKGVSHRFKKSDGEWIWLESKGINHLSNSFINGLVINSRDITDRMSLQKQLSEEHLNKQREITRAVIKAQEMERSQIGLELHDNVNQILTTVKLYNEMFLTGYREDKELLKKSTLYLQECINEIRSISKRLSAPTLGNITLNDSIKELVESINLTNRLDIRYYTEDLEDVAVSQDLHLAIYRIVQEALNNIIKYADASQATITIKKSKSKLCISIIDNGKGFDHHSKRTGIGLTNMKTRADNLKGSFKIKTAIGKGCTIEICFPI